MNVSNDPDKDGLSPAAGILNGILLVLAFCISIIVIILLLGG